MDREERISVSVTFEHSPTPVRFLVLSAIPFGCSRLSGAVRS